MHIILAIPQGQCIWSNDHCGLELYIKSAESRPYKVEAAYSRHFVH